MPRRIGMFVLGLVVASFPARVGAVGGTDATGCYAYSDSIALAASFGGGGRV